VQYPVLSDTKGDARKAYGVGKWLLGLADARVTYVIDGKGIVRSVRAAESAFCVH
jgi:peroxiredoxin Q/BCP